MTSPFRKRRFNLLYGLYHCQTHVYAVAGVLGPADRKPGDAVVTVAQDLDPHALIVLEKEAEVREGRLLTWTAEKCVRKRGK